MESFDGRQEQRPIGEKGIEFVSLIVLFYYFQFYNYDGTYTARSDEKKEMR